VTYPIHDHVDIYGNLSVNCTYRTAQNTAPGVMNVYVPAGQSAGNGVFLQSAGSGGIDQPFLAWRNANQAVQLSIWTDMAGGASRIKSQGSLSFHTANVALNSAANERMMITSAGAVGIGTPSPDAKLVVKSNDNARSTPILRTVANNETIGLSLGYDSITVNGPATYSDLLISSKGSGHLLLQAPQMGTAGNVGIGLNGAPEELLHLKASGSPTMLVESTSANNPALRLRSASATGTVKTEGAQRMVIGYDAWGNLEFEVGSAGPPKLVIQPSGNVGIGTASPEAKLTVNGAVTTGVSVMNHAQYGLRLEATPTSVGVGKASLKSITSGYPLVLGADQGDDIWIVPGQNGGNVGIGTSNPTVKLDVVGDVRVTGTIFGHVSGGISQDSILAKQITLAGLLTGQPRLTSDGPIQVTGSIRETSGSLGFTTAGDSPLPVKVGSLVVSSNYGQSAPSEGIAVAGAVRLGPMNEATGEIIPNVSVNGAARTLRFSNTSSASGEGFEFFNGGSSASLVMIQQNGNVGIGITQPQAKLHVAGAVTVQQGIQAGAPITTINEADITSSGDVRAGATKKLLVGTKIIADSQGSYYA